MTVIRYDGTKHPAGFQGFRVVRTIGTEADYRQRYFAYSYYGYRDAEKLAYALDEKWEKEAARTIRRERVSHSCQSGENPQPNIIVKGFRADIEVSQKKNLYEWKTYFTPGFYVQNPGYGKSAAFFRIRKWGYQPAFKKAAEKYCKIHQLPPRSYRSLLEKLPDQEVFTQYLLRKIRKNGHKLSKKTLIKALNYV